MFHSDFYNQSSSFPPVYCTRTSSPIALQSSGLNWRVGRYREIWDMNAGCLKPGGCIQNVDNSIWYAVSPPTVWSVFAITVRVGHNTDHWPRPNNEKTTLGLALGCVPRTYNPQGCMATGSNFPYLHWDSVHTCNATNIVHEGYAHWEAENETLGKRLGVLRQPSVDHDHEMPIVFIENHEIRFMS